MQGVLLRTFEGDPRLSDAQVRAMDRIAAADPHARILGLDGRMRPVLQANLGVPRSARKFSIMRNGDPATIECVSGTTKQYSEAWQERKPSRPWMDGDDD
mgnify:CR=1 FL=1